jgi:hypothetical protein
MSKILLLPPFNPENMCPHVLIRSGGPVKKFMNKPIPNSPIHNDVFVGDEN